VALFGLGVLEVVWKEEAVEVVDVELVRGFLSTEDEEMAGREDDCESRLRISCRDA